MRRMGVWPGRAFWIEDLMARGSNVDVRVRGPVAWISLFERCNRVAVIAYRGCREVLEVGSHVNLHVET